MTNPVGWDSDEQRTAYLQAIEDLRHATDAMTLRIAMAAEDDSHSLAKNIVHQVKKASDALQFFPIDSRIKTLSTLLGQLAEFIASEL